jgi:hypothetical protein
MGNPDHYDSAGFDVVVRALWPWQVLVDFAEDATVPLPPMENQPE